MWKALLLAAFPLAAIARREAQLGRRSWPDEGFKGIYWEHADNVTICSKEKRDVLMQTVKNLDVLLGNSQDSPAEIEWSTRPEWERFMGGRRNGVDKSQPKHNRFIDEGKPNYVDKLQKVRANILSSIAAAASFPRNGHKKPEIPGQPSMRRITFLCEGPGERIPGHCADTQRRPAAYTTVPEPDGSMGWSITFCDRFFEFAGGDTPHTFLDRVLADGYNANIKRLETYEHMMLHEYMIMGHPVHIIDEQDILPSVGGHLVNVYGATWSSEFAHVKYLTEESVNTKVATNADNYAWLHRVPRPVQEHVSLSVNDLAYIVAVTNGRLNSDGTCGCSNGSDGTVFPAVPEGRTYESLSVGESV
ncbi:hypothetical protein GTA08_BOTSDO07330 [Botryosphaeria dothidea]|uniref:Uncharacterized protein n=1 Tax=Botryosphaeria dothidea TaxID=55169 RepID=A0A8H4IRM7_9PEZI|nr:hypothetical protein GTA08_BOTSDO11523 [Botryosphaeria dothidea]KAF4305104.1 hypothetical protein GTA08_BOTSDO07330 [Botryosphaeria dothidea]